MKVNVIAAMLGQIEGLAELDELLTARAAMRRVYEEMAAAYRASHNELFADYANMVTQAGLLVNAEIQAWYNRAAMLHGSVSPEDAPKESEENDV